MEPIYAEEIIKARRNTGKEEAPETKETAYRLENGKEKGYVIVRYEQLELKEKDIMDGRAEMLLPENLKEMDGELMKRKYPDPDRPEWIVSDAGGEAAMSFHLEEGEVGEGELEQIAGLLKKEITEEQKTQILSAG